MHGRGNVEREGRRRTQQCFENMLQKNSREGAAKMDMSTTFQGKFSIPVMYVLDSVKQDYYEKLCFVKLSRNNTSKGKMY